MHNKPRIGTVGVIAALAVVSTLPACDMRYTPDESVEAVETSQSSSAVQTEPYLAAVGRSPIPAEGEVLDAPIPAVELAPPPQVEPLTVSAEPPPEGAIVPWSEAAQYFGHVVTTEGVIAETANIGNVCFLNFVAGDREKFYVVMYEEAYPGVPGGEPEAYYLNKKLRVTGEVTAYRNRPQIRVHDASQIEVVDETGQ